MAAKISIIVPVYNAELFLKKCIESITKQTYTDLEIILVNDGSQDNSRQLCDEYAKNDARIKVIHQTNKGVSETRNNGLKIASGDFIGFVDSDDWIEPEMYEDLINLIIETDSEIGICNVIESNKLTTITNTKSDYRVIENNELLNEYIDNGFYVVRNLYSKKIIKDIFFLQNIPLTEDIFFGVDIVEKVNKAVITDYPYYTYFKENLASATQANYNKNKFFSLDANLYLQSKAEKIFPLNIEIQEVIRLRIVNNCLYHLQNIYSEENKDLDIDYKFRKKVKSSFNKNFKLDGSLYNTIIWALNPTFLKYFYKLQNFSSKK